MFLGKKDKARKYNIVIIPERGSATKKISLSSVLIKNTAALFVIIGVFAILSVVFFLNRYHMLSKDSMALKDRDDYIKTLEKDNKKKAKEIQNYKVYQKSISGKIEKLDELEKDIKDKLNKSDFLKDTDTLQGMNTSASTGVFREMSYLEESQPSIEAIDNQIKALTKINEQLDELLEREQYIPSVPPCRGRITSFFGTRDNPFNSGSGEENHPAIDIANGYGTEIHATAKGKVVYAEVKNGYGNCVCLDHGNGLESLYGHASQLLVKEGQIVEKGQVIALMGSTGRSTGPHVHFELRKNNTPIDPIKILE